MKTTHPTISLPETLIFHDSYVGNVTVNSEDFSTEQLINSNDVCEGFRISGDVSGFGTIAFDIFQGNAFIGFDEKYVEIVNNYNIVDTASLLLSEESLDEIEMILPD